VHDPASHAGSDDRPGVPEPHGNVPLVRRRSAGVSLGQGVQLRLVGWDDIASIVALVLLFDDPRSTSFVLTAIGLGIVIVGVLLVSNVWKTPTYNLIVLGPIGYASGLAALFHDQLDPTGGDLGGVRRVHFGFELPLAGRASLPIVSAL
jgi:hypothetical protein